MRPVQDLVAVQRRQTALLEQLLARDPDIAYLFTTAGIDQLRDRIEERLGFYCSKVYRGDIGPFPGNP